MSTANGKELPPEMRAQVMRELGAALERVALDMPHAEAGMILKMAIGYFAGVHAEHYGHVQTAKLLTRTARLGFALADAEQRASTEMSG